MTEISHSPAFVAASRAMQRVRAEAESLAQVSVPVLIVGEKGTGKSTTAQLLHKLSARSRAPFAQVSCALASDDLDQELFGIEVQDGVAVRGPGKLESCCHGTLLLKDVSEMRPSLAAKLIRALETDRIAKFGDVKINSAARLLATSTVQGNHRQPDRGSGGALMSHLSAFTIQVPPLRQRKEDIPLLLAHFMKKLAGNRRLPLKGFSARTLEACVRYSWPGNLTELENFVKGYLALGDDALPMIGGGVLRSPGLRVEISQESLKHAKISRPESTPSIETRRSTLATESVSLKALIRNVREETERSAIGAALNRTRGNRKEAARLLQISYRGLLYKIKQHQLGPPHC